MLHWLQDDANDEFLEEDVLATMYSFRYFVSKGMTATIALSPSRRIVPVTLFAPFSII